MSALDSTHTVVVKSENRGIRVVIGALAIMLLARWWWTGSVLHAVAAAMPPADGEPEFGSVTGALLPIFIDLLWFIGSVVIFATTNLAAILWDVLSGIFETFRFYAARRTAVDQAQKAATEAGTQAGATNAGAIASTVAVDAAGNAAATTGVPKPTGPKLNVDKLKRLLDSHENKLTAADQVFSKLNERLIEQGRRLANLEVLADQIQKQASSEAEPPKPAYRRATRQTPAKASTRKSR